MAEEENNIKCPICSGNIVGETTMPEFGWKSSYHCENGHWFMK